MKIPKFINMPSISEEISQVKIVRYLKNIGDYIEEGEPILEVENDYLMIEIPSDTSGTLVRNLKKESDFIKVGDKICEVYNKVNEDVDQIYSQLKKLNNNINDLENYRLFYYELTDLLKLPRNLSKQEVIEKIKSLLK